MFVVHFESEWKHSSLFASVTRQYTITLWVNKPSLHLFNRKQRLWLGGFYLLVSQWLPTIEEETGLLKVKELDSFNTSSYIFMLWQNNGTTNSSTLSDRGCGQIVSLV